MQEASQSQNKAKKIKLDLKIVNTPRAEEKNQ